jgi:hypothetical protein
MATALALQADLRPIYTETVSATMPQLHALASAISEIDSFKGPQPSELPRLMGTARHAVATIWNNVLYPLHNPAVEIQSEQLQAFSDCLKCMQEVIVVEQYDLLSPFIETAHDLITLMAGDKASELYDQETPA